MATLFAVVKVSNQNTAELGQSRGSSSSTKAKKDNISILEFFLNSLLGNVLLIKLVHNSDDYPCLIQILLGFFLKTLLLTLRYLLNATWLLDLK